MPLKRYTPGDPVQAARAAYTDIRAEWRGSPKTSKELKEMTTEGKKRWTVTYGGFEIYEGNDEEKAYDAFIECGPYGRIWETEE